MTTQEDIEAFMSTHFPYVPLDWLGEINDSLRIFTQKNGGNVEMTTRFKAGEDEWTDWKERRVKRRKK